MSTTNHHPPAAASAVGITADARAPRRGHIGRVVVGSMATGLLAAVVALIGPAAGAREHVVAGFALLSFAGGWALLARWSTRGTDQPQRWAAVPAAAMAVAGAGMLAFAPTSSAAGWVWAPATIALAAFVAVQSRRHLRSRSRPLVIYPVCAALALGGVGGLYETAREASDTTAAAMPGRLVDVGGHRLHIACTGSGQPTVVLEPGLGQPSTAMAWIARGVAPTTRVCVYDRAGRGWSDAVATPQDGDAIAADLHTLLARAGEPGPFVFAGHSAGGIYVLDYARLFPGQVAGVVLLDSMHPEQYTRVPSWPAFYETFRRASGVLPVLARFGIGRIIADVGPADLPQPERDQQRNLVSTPRHYRSVRDEFSRLRTAMRQAGELTTLGDRPLVVVTATDGAQDGWVAAQDDLAHLSTDVDHRIERGATHASLVERRDAPRSIDAIAAVVHSVRSGSALTH